MVLWTRPTGTDLPSRTPVGWEVTDDEAFTRIAARGREEAEFAWAHSVHAKPAGLAPGRWYFYRFRALGQQSRVGRTRSAPAPDAAATLRLAIANCQRWDQGHYAAWRHAAAATLDCTAFWGDYIYESASPADAPRRHDGSRLRSLDDYRARYAQYKTDPALQDAHAACPWLLVWDDHEVENDYAGSAAATPRGLDMAGLRAAAYRAYWEHQPFAKAQRPRGKDMRIVGRLDRGRLARIHLLDDRQYRDPQACRCRSGPAAPTSCCCVTVRRWPTPRARCWAASRSSGWPKAGAWAGPGTCWPSRRRCVVTRVAPKAATGPTAGRLRSRASALAVHRRGAPRARRGGAGRRRACPPRGAAEDRL